ncbi:hypothetical protein VIGAN_03144400 [Vigna angularis var. angularis]|uniref:Uncharacterized protein n=1 Tax=Vigna angularis var. angularis TaxID=157739 RepID=A0A0S3RM65_PHAAN|nr:hypothetical protein VIGAN_03144400 [Vigna angularis var. angularis]
MEERCMGEASQLRGPSCKGRKLEEDGRSSKSKPHFAGDNGGAGDNGDVGGGRTMAARRWTQRVTRERNQTAKWRFLCASEMEDARTTRLVVEVRPVLMEVAWEEEE